MPSDFHLFDPLEDAIRGKKFENDEEVIAEIRRWLKSRLAEWYHKKIQALTSRHKVIDLEQSLCGKIGYCRIGQQIGEQYHIFKIVKTNFEREKNVLHLLSAPHNLVYLRILNSFISFYY